jgi:AcrR family transcriptional regulator
MDRIPGPVKPTRRYNSSRRREQARQTRHAILDAAQRLFLVHGYGATTVASIARASDVSVETIYKGFGGKGGLVRALWHRGLEGSGPIPAERRSDEMQQRERDPRTVIRNWGRFITEVAPRTVPIILLVRAASATDPEMATLLEQADLERLRRMEHNARQLLALGGLRDGLSLEDVRDVLWTYSSLELYELLVLRRGWAVERYGEFAADGMAAALLPQGAR